jgi:hypothetical protein
MFLRAHGIHRLILYILVLRITLGSAETGGWRDKSQCEKCFLTTSRKYFFTTFYVRIPFHLKRVICLKLQKYQEDVGYHTKRDNYKKNQ